MAATIFAYSATIFALAPADAGSTSAITVPAAPATLLKFAARMQISCVHFSAVSPAATAAVGETAGALVAARLYGRTCPLVLLALLGYGLWWGWEQLTRPFSDSTPCVTQSASVLITTQVTVQVFNGGSAS